MKFIIAAIVVILILIGLLTFLPKNITSPVANIFGRKAASPSPSVRAVAVATAQPTIGVVSSPQPTISLNTGNRSAAPTSTPKTTTDPYTGSTITVTPNPNATSTPGSKVASAALPGTGEEKEDPLMLTLQTLLSSFTLILGWKLSRYIS